MCWSINRSAIVDNNLINYTLDYLLSSVQLTDKDIHVSVSVPLNSVYSRRRTHLRLKTFAVVVVRMTLKAAVNQNDIMHMGGFLSGNYILNAHAHLLRIYMRIYSYVYPAEVLFRFQMPSELLDLMLLFVITGNRWTKRLLYLLVSF